MSNEQNERREMPRTDMTGAEMVVPALKDNGVKHVFGYPGGAVLPIYDEIFQQDAVEHILVRHEQGAGHAAEGYARSTGKAGVMLVTSAGRLCGHAAAGCVDGFDSAGLPTGQVQTSLIGSMLSRVAPSASRGPAPSTTGW
jgi:acetolactate synthase-1/2/3 large subunit